MALNVTSEYAPDRARRRRDVQEKLYNFLNRSAQSISRSNSQSGRSRTQELASHVQLADEEHHAPRASHADGTPRISVTSNIKVLRARASLEQQPNSTSASPRSTRSIKSNTVGSARQLTASPISPTREAAKKSFEYPYNTPPHTPSSSRQPSHPSSPSSVRGIAPGDLLLTRSVSRPTTPSSTSNTNPPAVPSTPSRKVLGITLPSPSLIRRNSSKDKEIARLGALKLRSGSDSSNEPLLMAAQHPRSRTSESNLQRPERSLRTTPQKANNSNGRVEGKLPTPVSIDKQRQASAPAEQSSPTAAKISKLDFWRTVTPRPSFAQEEHAPAEKPNGRSRTLSTGASGAQSSLVIPQAVRAMDDTPAFLPPVPQLRRTPPTPQRDGDKAETRETRLDSFLSDSVPLPLNLNVTSSPTEQDPNVPRQHSFSKMGGRQASTGLGIERSRSAPGVRGRLSPCLRIPSPKFLSKDRSRSNSRSRERNNEKEKKTTLSVGAPILREPTRAHMHAHAHPHTHLHTSPRTAEFSARELGVPGAADSGVAIGGVANTNANGGLKGGKASLTHIRRAAAHGTFDFERPGSRTSDKSGQDGSMGTRSDDEGDDFGRLKHTKQRDANVSSSTSGRSKVKTGSPVPPVPSHRLNSRAPPPPPPRTPNRSRTPDDTALPRLSSGLVRRNSGHGSSSAHTHGHSLVQSHSPSASPGRAHRGCASLPPFSFEPAASSVAHTNFSTPKKNRPEKPVRDVSGGTYVDMHTGLIMWASPASSVGQASPQGSVSGRRNVSKERERARKERRKSVAGGATTKIDSRELEEATAVIMQFKSALDDAGFATLQKYVRRYDAQIMPLDGSSGLLVRVQRLLDMSAPRTDERKKRDLMQQFTNVVTRVS